MAADLLDETIAHLRVLVGYDTRNPPRAIGRDMFDYLRTQLHGFDCALHDHGAGCFSFLAVRGEPKLLFNVHLDTVPDSPQWSANPFDLRVDKSCAIGLGACDIKGAAAALLAVANASDGDFALLFTTDEEGRSPRCVAEFLSGAHDFDKVIVAEPTRCEAALAHRGMQSVHVHFEGRAGHASGEQQPNDSAVHQALRWGHAALDFASAQSHQRFGGLTGLRLNVGLIEGGIKPNIIAPSAALRLDLRPLPTMSPGALLDALYEVCNVKPARVEEAFRGASLPAGDPEGAETRRLAARDIADELGLPIGNAVDFWTEAALFSAAGYTAIVYGPGDIAQAHSADEWVALDQLRVYAQTICRIVEDGRA